MQIPALPSVECAILHDQFKPLDAQLIFRSVKRLAAKFKIAPDVQLMQGSTETCVFVHAGGHRVLVSQYPQPLGAEIFRNALMTPYTATILPNAQDVVARHGAHTLVTIGKIMSGFPAEVADKDGNQVHDAEAYSNAEEAERAMFFCRELSKLIIQNNPAAALH